MFREQHIRIAWELLGNKGWLANPALRAGHD
jgi:hypothetical protein